MKGRLYIDGKDAYTEYGVYVVQGGWNELVAYPPLKAVDGNDWQEEDGIEVDLSAPVLNTREVSLKIAFSDFGDRFFAFISILSDNAYHTFDCRHIKRTYRLRLVSQPNLTVAQAIGTATLKFADDFPLPGYTYKRPASNVAAYDDYTFDGMKFTDYGVRVLKGTLDEVMKTPTVKTNLLRNISTQAGALYDGKNVSYKSKDVKIQCLMRANTLDELWRNYDALLYDLIRPEERVLKVKKIDKEFPFYYKSCQITDFYPTGKIWLQFTLTVTFTTWKYIDAFDAEYKKLNFIENTSDAHINTGIEASHKLKFYIKFADYRYQNECGLFGSSSWNNSLTYYYGTLRYCLHDRAYSFYCGDGVILTGEITCSEDGCKGDFEFKQIHDANGGGGNIFLFKGGRNLVSKAKIISFKIWDKSGILARDFVPVMRKSDNEVGMYDLIEKKFYQSVNSSKFTGE